MVAAPSAKKALATEPIRMNTNQMEPIGNKSWPVAKASQVGNQLGVENDLCIRGFGDPELASNVEDTSPCARHHGGLGYPDSPGDGELVRIAQKAGGHCLCEVQKFSGVPGVQ